MSLRVRENGILEKVLINSNVKRNVTNRFLKQEEVPLFLKSMTRQFQLLWKIRKDPSSDQYRSSFSLNYNRSSINHKKVKIGALLNKFS